MKLMFAVLLCILTVGCGHDCPEPAVSAPSVPPTPIVVETNSPQSWTQPFTVYQLLDGTRCAIYHGHAIDCWQPAEPLPMEVP